MFEKVELIYKRFITVRIPKNIIPRDLYVSKIEPFIDTSLIKVLTGQRRVGKSYLLFQLINVIKKRVPKSNIIYINLEDFEFDNIKTAKDLNDYIVNKLSTSKRNYIFIDEIQDVVDFEKVLRSLILDDNVDVYITGSNAKLLSSEIATILSGRYIEFNIYSLSYLEFLQFHTLDNNDDSLAYYLKYGGLPYISNLSLNDEIVFEYLQNIYNTIIYRDVVGRYNLRNSSFLEKLVRFMADRVGSLFSAKKISDFLKSQKTNISPNQIRNYTKYLSNAFVIHTVERYDIVGKRIFEIGEKYFFENIGIRNAIVGYKANDVAKVLENIVYNHLIYCGYKVKVGSINSKEIDFVCEKNNRIIYVQVCYKFEKQKTIDREFGNLLKIKDNHPKYVITADKFAGDDYKGISQVYIKDFLSTLY